VGSSADAKACTHPELHPLWVMAPDQPIVNLPVMAFPTAFTALAVAAAVSV